MGERHGAYVSEQHQPASKRAAAIRLETAPPRHSPAAYFSALLFADQVSVAGKLCQADTYTPFKPVTYQQSQTSRLYEEVRELQEQLRAVQAKCDELSIELHNRRTGHIVRRKLHAVLDLVQRITPEGVRARFRLAYLRVYRRLFPHGAREFGSADLVKLGEKNKSRSETLERSGADSPGISGSAGTGLARLQCYPSYRPLVSVVLPVWNQPGFLEESIRSVLGQSYEEIELIVVDDGSSVDLAPVLDALAGDPRLRVIRKDHEGIAQALNSGFRLARGELLTWTSADNVMHGEALETLVDFMLRHPGTDMVYANMELMDERTEPLVGSDLRLNNQRLHASHMLDLPESVETLELAEDNFIGACFMYRKSSSEVVGDYDGSRLGTEDYDYWLRMLLCGTIRHLDSDTCLYRYRIHGESLSAKYGRTVVAENISSLLGEHKQRKKHFRRPFAVDILYDGAPSFPPDTVVAIAAALRRNGHRVGVYSSSLPEGFHEDLLLADVLPLERAWLPEQSREGNSRARQKRILLSFLDPQSWGVKGPPWPDRPAFRFQWLPPDANPDSRPAGQGSSWLLCGSAGCLNRLTEDEQRRASLLIPSKIAYQDESLLFLKARDNSYPLPKIPQLDKPLALYVGPTEKTFFDAQILRDTAERYPEVQFVVIDNNGDDSASPADNSVTAMNVLYLHGESPSERLACLSQARLLLAPLRGSDSRLGDMQDLCHLYLLAGKPILATDAILSAGFRDLPNALIAPPEGFAEMLPAAFEINLNLAIADEYRLRRSANQLAQDLVNIANSRLFAC